MLRTVFQKRLGNATVTTAQRFKARVSSTFTTLPLHTARPARSRHTTRAPVAGLGNISYGMVTVAAVFE
jgi:hypothetical protein